MLTEYIQAQLNRIECNTLLASKEALTIDDVSYMTGISKSHLYKLTCSKQIPHYKPFGKMVYFDKAEIEKWLLKNRVNTEDEATQGAITYTLQKGGKL